MFPFGAAWADQESYWKGTERKPVRHEPDCNKEPIMWLHEVLIKGKAEVNTAECEGSSEEEEACMNMIRCVRDDIERDR